MRTRVVVVGADAAGMSAAHQALRTAARTGRELDVVALERTGHTSYSACGIPYWVAGDVASGQSLVARTADQHRAAGIDLRMGTTVEHVDLDRRQVHAAGPDGAAEPIGFDELVIATGARAMVPGWARGADGTLVEGVGVVKDLDDGALWLDRLVGSGHPVVVVGGGYIGVEMAEAAGRRGHRVTLLTRSRVMSNLDPDQSDRVEAALRAGGVEVRGDSAVDGIERTASGRLAVHTTHGTVEAGHVVLAIGVEPVTEFVDGPAKGTSGGLRPDERGALGPGLWAAGDCCEVRHRVTGQWVYLPLGTHANKLGRAVGDNLAGGSLRFEGALGTAITRYAAHPGSHPDPDLSVPQVAPHAPPTVAGAAYLEISRTGLSTRHAEQAGLDVLAVTTEGTTASGYLPEAEPIAVRVLADRGTRRLLGAQITGGHGAGKRIDAFATALWAGMTVDDFAWLDLSYAPPFATAWEITQVAARRVAERL